MILDERVQHTPGRVRFHPQEVASHNYGDLLYLALKVGFGLAGTGRDKTFLRPQHTSPAYRMFGAAFSSDNDKVVADTVYAWIADSGVRPLGAFVY